MKYVEPWVVIEWFEEDVVTDLEVVSPGIDEDTEPGDEFGDPFA